jgi:hypothetical protein
MKTNTLLVIGGSFLALFTNFAVAGGASSAAVGPSSVAGATSGADGDGSGVLKKLNQHSVKSYTLMRQLLAASGVKGAGVSDGK